MFNVPPVGYTVTKGPVCLPSFWALGNRGWNSNYGMQTQYNMYPASASNLEMFLAQNKNTLLHTNPMLYGIINPNNNGNNAMAQQSLMTAAAQGAQAGMMIRVSVAVEKAVSALTAMTSQLGSLLESDKLNDSQKSRIEALLAKVEEAQKRLEETMEKASQSEDPKAVLNAVTEIQKEILALQKEGNELGKTIAEEVKTGKVSSDGSSSEEASDESGSTAGEEKKANENYDKNGRPKSLANPTEREIKDICLEFSDAIGKYTWGIFAGTDDDKFKASVAALDESNIIEVMNHWKENFCGSNKTHKDDKNFIDSFLLDADSEQKVKLGRHILDTLVKRAELNGLDVSAEEAMLRKELNSSVYIDNDVFEAQIESIYNKIVAKENENAKNVTGEKTEVKEKENTKKVDEDKKREEKIDKKKAQFLQDMKECLDRDDLTELPIGLEVEKDDKGNFTSFKIRIKGKDYVGKDYLAIVAALEKDELKLPVPAKKEQAA